MASPAEWVPVAVAAREKAARELPLVAEPAKAARVPELDWASAEEEWVAEARDQRRLRP